MSYFIFDGVLECGRQYELNGEEARHILKSRRRRVGDYFLIQDEQGGRFDVVWQTLSRNSTKFVPETPLAVPPQSPLRLELCPASPNEQA